MNREIGSEFWNIPMSSVENGLFPDNVKWFISGRSALTAIISDITKNGGIRSVCLPSWCCDSMIVPFLKKGIEVRFYNPFGDMNDISGDAVVTMGYFGFQQDLKLQDFQGIIIRDITHSLFSGWGQGADYCYGSLRKWAGFPGGGYAWGFRDLVEYDGSDQEYLNLRKKAMYCKQAYIYEQETDATVSDKNTYLELFREAEERLQYDKIEHADAQDACHARLLDKVGIVQKRRKNAAVLLSSLGDCAVFSHMDDSACPLFVPIMVENRDRVRKHLISNRIYCPVHWPLTQYHSVDERSMKLYEKEISLVCDQRYDEEDMDRMVKVILSADGGLQPCSKPLL